MSTRLRTIKAVFRAYEKLLKQNCSYAYFNEQVRGFAELLGTTVPAFKRHYTRTARYLIILITILPGCGACPTTIPLSFSIADDLPTCYVGAFHEAINHWNTQTGSEIANTDRGVSLLSFDGDSRGTAAIAYVAAHNDTYCHIKMIPIKWSKTCFGHHYDLAIAVLVHEIGHCLGMPHSTDENSIMWPTVNYRKKLTCNDLLEAEKASGLTFPTKLACNIGGMSGE